MTELPRGWEAKTFGDLFRRLQYGLTAKADHNLPGLRFLRITDIKDTGQIDWSLVPSCVVADDDVSRYKLSDGDFVFARSGSIEKAARIRCPPPAVFASYLIRGVPVDQKHADWLAWFILSPLYLEQMRAAAAGIGLSNVNATKLSAVVVPIPPLPEQDRIVRKLDSLFNSSKSARAELARIPRLAERYKQATLAAAFNGELTSDWRARNPTADKPCVPAGRIDGRVSVLPAPPEKWLWTSIASVASVTGGLTKNAQRRSLATKVRYLRVANVYANELRLDDVGEIGCTQSELERTRLVPGDLLVVEGNGSPEQIGRVAIWNAEVPECSHQNHLIRVRLGPLAIPKFLLYWILSPGCRSAIERVASSSSGLYTLSISKVSGLPIPLCGVAEQEVIVLRIAEAFIRIDALFAEASRAASLLDRLDQATLAKAFRGELIRPERLETRSPQ